MARHLQLTALARFPLVEPGDDLAGQIIASAADNDLRLATGDVLVIAQKIVSKAENRYAYLNRVTPSPRAIELAHQADKDPRVMELILAEATEVLRVRKGAVIVRHRNGYVHANAGIDQSNISSDASDPRVLLLPENPDASAAELKAAIHQRLGVTVNIVINDSAGRPWRNGIVGFAIGTAGFDPVADRIGCPDLFGRALEITQVAVADELAAAGSLLMGQGDEGLPVVLVRGAALTGSAAGSRALIRPLDQDLFR